MKKLVNALVLFLCLFLFKINTYALTNSGTLYEEYYQSSGVNVFATSSTNTMDYNGIQVKNTNDSKIYYCIEPEILMPGKSGAYKGSHNLFIGENNIINNSRLTKGTLNLVKLLAYYGYQYGNHTNKKWYGITQVMIWRVLRGDIKWTFKTGRYGTNNTSLHVAEVVELNNLVAKHGQRPSFHNQNIKLLLNQSITLTDINNVIQNFTAINNEYVDIKIAGNRLIVTAKKVGRAKIDFTWKDSATDNVTLFTNSTYQDVVQRGIVEKTDASISFEIKEGTLELNKKDYDTKDKVPQGDATLDGAIYAVFDLDDNKIIELTIKDNTTMTTLPLGKYKLKELIPPLGYNLNEEVIEFELTLEKPDLSIDVFDLVIKGKHIITKLKGGSGEEYQPEVNAKFQIIHNDKIIKEIITNDQGIAEIILPYGKYTIKQIEGETPYLLTEPYTIEIKENNQIIEKTLYNKKLSKLIFKKIDQLNRKPVENALINVFNDQDELIYEGLTNKEGIIEVNDLNIGKYYIKEKVAPVGYFLSNEIIIFDITENGLLIEKEMTNEKMIMPNTKADCNKNFLIFIILMAIISGVLYVKNMD